MENLSSVTSLNKYRCTGINYKLDCILDKETLRTKSVLIFGPLLFFSSAWFDFIAFLFYVIVFGFVAYYFVSVSILIIMDQNKAHRKL